MVVALACSPEKNGDPGFLATVDWQQNLTFYDFNGKQVSMKSNFFQNNQILLNVIIN